MSTAIEVRDVSRHYGPVRALDHVTLDIEADTITGLLGRNGAGKTVLMSLITAQDTPSSGTVRVLGTDPQRDERVLTKVTFLRDHQGCPADYKLSHLLRIAEVFHPGWDADLAAAIVEMFAIPSDRHIRKLSRGQLSAVAALVGLASRAPITLLDEPYLGMDATGRRQFYDLLLADFTEHPRTILISTHLIDEVEALLDHVVVLDRGHVRRVGSVESLNGVAHQISGPRAALEGVLGSFTPLDASWLGAMGSVTVEDAPEIVRAAKGAGLTVAPVSLQGLVAMYGLARASANEEVAA